MLPLMIDLCRASDLFANAKIESIAVGGDHSLALDSECPVSHSYCLV